MFLLQYNMKCYTVAKLTGGSSPLEVICELEGMAWHEALSIPSLIFFVNDIQRTSLSLRQLKHWKFTQGANFISLMK